MKTAVIYSRISTSIQDTNSQIEVLKDYTVKNNYQLLQIFQETISGVARSDQRVELNKLKAFVDITKVDLLLVYEISRLGRNTENVLKTLREFTEKGVNVYLLKENLFTLNPDGTKNTNTQLVLTMMAEISSVERETTMARSKRGLRYISMELGHWTGGRNLPYGYKRENKKLVIDEEESKIIREIFDMYINGSSSYKIRQELNNRGVKTRYNKAYSDKANVKTKTFAKHASEFKWQNNTIYKILTNKIYMGVRMYLGEECKAPAIISPELFKAVGERLKNNDNKKGKHTKNFYLLGDVKMKCGICGKGYFANKSKSSNQYICFSKIEKPDCKNYGISIDKLTYSVWFILRREKALTEHIQKSLAERDINKEIQSKENTLKELEKQFVVVDKNENFLIDRVMEGLMSQEIYDKRIITIIEERKAITKYIESTKTELEELREYRDTTADINNQIREIKGDKNKMKAVFTKVIKSLTFYPVKNRFSGMTTNLQDNILMIDLLLHNTPKPISYLISQRSQSIIPLLDNEYNYATNQLFGEPKEMSRRNKELIKNREGKYITQ
jgi:site-specific DNA recombinase